MKVLADLRILFISERAGFAGGIERFIFQTAGLLRQAGATVYGCFQRPDREKERFAENFDRICTPEDLPEADFAVIHRITDTAFLERLLESRGDRLALYVHDHECYCPRTYRYTPFGRKECFRPYSLLRCGLCAMATSPRRWRGGFFAELAARTTGARKRLRLLRQIPRVAVLSEFMRQNLLLNGFAPEQVTVIPPPVPVPAEAPLHEDHDVPRLLFTGQLIRGKGVDQLLRALALLEHDFRLTIAGDGGQRPELERLASELGLTEKVSFAGWVNDPEKLYASSDIAVFPFFWQEPFGLVGPEALARELPVAAFRTGGVDEWLRDGVTGLAVPPRDIPGFAAAVDKLLSDRELRLKLGRQGRELVQERFSGQEYVRNFGLWVKGGLK